ACSVPYLKLWGIVAGGWQMLRAAQVASKKVTAAQPDTQFYRSKIKTARLYAAHVLSMSAWLNVQIVQGAADVAAFSEEYFDS
ncbi:MAG: acyl-CoA dehydrogenase C-terminal domain-containing protein, partial [Candidatus Eremiobacteraeota bacterium]|nr:acyl-CoA dehydrogenase C-terminal domain-containing protein [Candidatus Eremiobacteraeota bacterium]